LCVLLRAGMQQPELTLIVWRGFETEPVARSCKEIRDRYDQHEDDGLYYLTTASGVMYQTFSDMTTAGSWTLVASVHENNIYGKCEVGNRWSSQQGSNPRVWPGAQPPTTSKSPGYYDTMAEDMSVKRFLTLQRGNQLFKCCPVRYNVGSCNRGPAILIYNQGDTHTRLMDPTINNERAAMAICSGVKPTGCNSEHYGIGGGGHLPGAAPILGCPLTGMSMDMAQAGVHLRRSLKLPCLFYH
uniref:Fibrinogen C-terminal domain-containing protein n=1 Tax=Hucho hucho TaxID=62062 RepID=A0A4W5LX43_9TELE